MIKDFIQFTKELFPSINPYTKDKVDEAIRQFNYDSLEWFTTKRLDQVSQGDIIEKLPFIFINDNGEKEIILAKGIILSNTCDISRDDYIIIAPLIDYSSFLEEDKKNIVRSNKYYDKLCFTNSQLDNYFVDFTRMTSFNRKVLFQLLETKTKIDFSLNQYGYYFLLTKMTIYFMRPEDVDVNDSRVIVG